MALLLQCGAPLARVATSLADSQQRREVRRQPGRIDDDDIRIALPRDRASFPGSCRPSAGVGTTVLHPPRSRTEASSIEAPSRNSLPIQRSRMPADDDDRPPRSAGNIQITGS